MYETSTQQQILKGCADITIIEDELHGHFVDLASRDPWKLLGIASVNPQEIHECCIVERYSQAPVFYDVCLTNYTTYEEIMVVNVQRNMNTGDAITLSSECHESVGGQENTLIGQWMLDFSPVKIKVDQDASNHLAKHFGVLGFQDTVVVIGEMIIKRDL